MLPAIPRACPILVIEGIPGAGKTSLQERLQRDVQDRPVHAYAEEALLFHWSHTWIPGIHALRLQLLQRMLAHIDAVLEIEPTALFVLTRFHLSHVLLGGKGDNPLYTEVVAGLGAKGAQVWVPIVPGAEIAARAAHPERRDPRWQAHLQKRLTLGGYPNLTAMYAQYQHDMLDMLAQQPVTYHLLDPQSRRTDDAWQGTEPPRNMPKSRKNRP